MNIPLDRSPSTHTHQSPFSSGETTFLTTTTTSSSDLNERTNIFSPSEPAESSKEVSLGEKSGEQISEGKQEEEQLAWEVATLGKQGADTIDYGSLYNKIVSFKTSVNEQGDKSVYYNVVRDIEEKEKKGLDELLDQRDKRSEIGKIVAPLKADRPLSAKKKGKKLFQNKQQKPASYAEEQLTKPKQQIKDVLVWSLAFKDASDLPDIKQLRLNLTTCLMTLIDASQGKITLPLKPLIAKMPVSTDGFAFAAYYREKKQSELPELGGISRIKTSSVGDSGEASKSRDLETFINEATGLAERKQSQWYIAGHLVGKELGGKDKAYNLTPLTNEFNLHDHNSGMRKVEKIGEDMLKAGKVIEYGADAKYGNKGDKDIVDVVPTSIKVTIKELSLKDAGDSKNIEDWEAKDSGKDYNLSLGSEPFLLKKL